ncbi:MAG: hypothetical protein ACOYYU_02450 [Chloroflexota bacterium]
MEDNQTQKDTPLLNAFFVVAGTLLIVLSFVIRALKFESAWVDISVDVLLNVGASLIATAGVAYLYQRFGTNSISLYIEKLLKHFSITQQAMDLGIKEMWRERRNIGGPMWNEFTESAKSEVWLMGMAEHGFAEDDKFLKIVSDGVSRGCNYRFLLLDPSADVTKLVDEREGGTGKLQALVRDSVRIFTELQESNKKKKGKIELRVHSNVPQVSIVRSDDEFLITPYMFYRPGDSSFTLLVRKTPNGIYDQYVEFFNKMWEKAYPPKTDSGK